MNRPYSSYKDSGIEWIGQIPSHWNIKRLKYLDKTIMGQSPESTDCNKEGVGIPFLQGNADFSGLNPMPSVWCDHPNKLAQKDDILLSVRAPVGAVNVADQTYGIGRGLCAIRPKYSHKKYSYYRALCLLDELNRIATGSTYTAVAVDQVNNVVVPNSAYDEQGILSNYLDRKTAQIDDLIAKQEKMIELLQEEYLAVINQVVTRGLDQNVSMKDSGVLWIGQIPLIWEMRKVGRSFRYIGSGTTPDSSEQEYYENGSIPWVITGDLNDDILRDSTKKITELAFNNFSALKMFPIGAILIAMYGATIGKTAIVDFEGCCNQACCVLADSAYFYNKFVFYWFVANKPNIISLGYGGGQPNISQDAIKSLKLPCPMFEEQERIINFLDRKTAQINAQIGREQKSIKLLKEFRTSLISEVVTGKIDVRNN